MTLFSIYISICLFTFFLVCFEFVSEILGIINTHVENANIYFFEFFRNLKTQIFIYDIMVSFSVGITRYGLIRNTKYACLRGRIPQN
jgi:hypothetical protein